MARRVISNRLNAENNNNHNHNYTELYNQRDEFLTNLNMISDTVDKVKTDTTALLTDTAKTLQEAKDVNATNQDVQKQLDNIILENSTGGNTDAEVVQARGNYPLLNERLDAIKTVTDTQSAEMTTARGDFATLDERLGALDETAARGAAEQPDFVDKLGRLTNFDEIHIKKANEKTFTVSNFNKATGRHLTNAFTKNINDDYYILSESYVGGSTASELPKEYVNYTMVSGTIDTNYATHYATEIGTKIKATISGTEIYMRRYGDNRGGIWEFTIDGDTSNKVKISTFKSVAGTDEVKIIGGLDDKPHLLEATFTGNDPDNPPSGGVSRAWLPYSSTSDTSKTFLSRFVNFMMGRDFVLNSSGSNKDFALRIKPKGYSGDYQFVPEHNGIGTAFKINEPQFLLDGKQVDVFSLPTGVSAIGKKFTLVQSVHGRYPTTNINLLRIDNVHEVSLNSSVRMLGKVAVLQDIDIQDGYFLMQPVSTDTATRLKTSRFNDYDTTKTDGSQTKLTLERDDTTSFLFTSSVNTNLFSALRVNDPYRSLRTGQEGKFPEGQTAWIEHRNTSMQKLYQSIYRMTSVNAGTNLYYDGVYLSGEVPNVHNLF